MNNVLSKNNKNSVPRFQNYLSEMPPAIFFTLFFLISGYLLLTKIESTDLWWHLSCGRYFFENGIYPPNGTFTFSPISQSTSNSHTWLGDLFLYCIHKFFGGETGLQIFRIIVVCIPAWVFIKLTDNRYNTWTLLGSVFIVMGTYQQNLLRNSIFAMIFLPLMVWLWHTTLRNRNFKFLLFYPVILLFWTHMHGYALVGIVILALFFLGEIIDQLIRKESRNFRFLLVLLIILGCSWKIVNINWSVNIMNRLSKIEIASIVSPSVETQSIQKNHVSNELRTPVKKEQAGDSFPTHLISLKDRVKKLFRSLMKGGDAEIVLEYMSPFDAYGILPSKALFIFSFLYTLYLCLALIYDPKGLRASYILPSLATIFLGLGYLRTIAFPFLVAFPLMAIHLPIISKKIALNKTRLAGFLKIVAPWIGLVFYFLIIFYFFGTSVKLFTVFSITSVIIMSVFWLTSFQRGEKLFNPKLLFLWLLPLFFCLQFVLAESYYYKEKKFYKLTGISLREPGIGRNSSFRDTLPDHILQKYKNEKMFNSHSLGGFLIWKWFNEKKVFIDSRSITYNGAFYKDYTDNYAFGYIDSLGIDKALLNISMDEEYIHAYLDHNWALLSFDINSVLLKKGTQREVESSYGIIPNYIGSLDDVALLSDFKLWNLGAFIDKTLRYMLLFGRLADAFQWIENIEDLIEILPIELQKGIQQKIEFMGMLAGHFGRINDPVLATACRKIGGSYTPVSLKMVLGDTFLGLNRKKKAAHMYMTAAELKSDDINLQRKVGLLLLQMGFVNQAIQQYRTIVNLDPDIVDEYITLAYLFASKKEFDQSEKYLRIVLEKSPKHQNIHLNLGLILSAKGETKAAIDIYKKGLSIFPENSRLKEELKKLE